MKQYLEYIHRPSEGYERIEGTDALVNRIKKELDLSFNDITNVNTIPDWIASKHSDILMIQHRLQIGIYDKRLYHKTISTMYPKNYAVALSHFMVHLFRNPHGKKAQRYPEGFKKFIIAFFKKNYNIAQQGVSATIKLLGMLDQTIDKIADRLKLDYDTRESLHWRLEDIQENWRFSQSRLTNTRYDIEEDEETEIDEGQSYSIDYQFQVDQLSQDIYKQITKDIDKGGTFQYHEDLENYLNTETKKIMKLQQEKEIGLFDKRLYHKNMVSRVREDVSHTWAIYAAVTDSIDNWDNHKVLSGFDKFVFSFFLKHFEFMMAAILANYMALKDLIKDAKRRIDGDTFPPSLLRLATEDTEKVMNNLFYELHNTRSIRFEVQRVMRDAQKQGKEE